MSGQSVERMDSSDMTFLILEANQHFIEHVGAPIVTPLPINLQGNYVSVFWKRKYPET